MLSEDRVLSAMGCDRMLVEREREEVPLHGSTYTPVVHHEHGSDSDAPGRKKIFCFLFNRDRFISKRPRILAHRGPKRPLKSRCSRIRGHKSIFDSTKPRSA